MDRKILLKSIQLTLLGLLVMLGLIVILLIVNTLNHQIVYWNTGVDRNAFNEVFSYIVRSVIHE